MEEEKVEEDEEYGEGRRWEDKKLMQNVWNENNFFFQNLQLANEHDSNQNLI